MISYNQWLNDWRFFCALCERFERTIQFVDDRINDDGSLTNGTTFSNEFCDILLTTAAEFENVAKQICKESDSRFNESNATIIVYTKIILAKFPKIGQTIICSPVQTFRPLENWKVSDNNNTTTVDGLDWWKAHNKVKHHRYPHFSEASFQNCYYAIASLFVLELYAAYFVTNGNPIYQISDSPCKYFSSEYLKDLILPHPKELPDFEK